MDERKPEKRLYRADKTTTTDTETDSEREQPREWGLDRRTFIGAATLLGLGGGALGGLPAPVAAEVVDEWLEQIKLTASDATSNAEFGRSVALSEDGTTALIGSARTEAAYLYDLNASPPTETKLTASDGEAGSRFGWSVGISSNGSTALVSAPTVFGFDDSSGSAYVYDLSVSPPTETKLTASDDVDGDYFGVSAALSKDGNTALIGDSTDDDAGDNSGGVYIYDLSVSPPTESKVTASDAADADLFGSAVAVSSDGNTALVGAPRVDRSAFSSDWGAAYVYDLSVSPPTETKLVASDGSADDRFGESVAVSSNGNTAIISSPGDDTAGTSTNSGSAYVYDLSVSPPTETKLVSSDISSADRFGQSVAVSGDGNTAFVGNPGDDGASADTGAVYVYDLSVSPPTESKFTVSDSSGGALLGDSIAGSADGNTALAGAPKQQPSDLIGSGAAYVFTRSTEPENQPPTASFSYDPTDPEVGEELTFDASGSTDPDGDGTIVSYDWSFDDGTTGTGQTTTHTYTAEADYEVTLTVTDDAGETDMATQTVPVVVFADPLVVTFRNISLSIGPPQDLDGDGLYEDVNADGVAQDVTGPPDPETDDVDALNAIVADYESGSLALNQYQVTALDFNGDGILSRKDVNALRKLL
ncbi:PKD domain-containing protein [Halogeometricum sp. S1BR25-6]|uniref:PKD domain-containing protein n=1 Tax=Halogeometricum salsisoli TaxID=2950536 RepID=A0ABU2GLM3_9EURY|nr:PKD domain-containing protein [Halogeometricum sp. S1BR25-6]MDS0301104.1 PKD domain-containing protein [Halogeometricum sp. S1BR25-6]